jgi:hypothetical protein
MRARGCSAHRVELKGVGRRAQSTLRSRQRYPTKQRSPSAHRLGRGGPVAQVTEDGLFMERRRIGPWCREDDELCIRYMEEAEERFQAQARECAPGDPLAGTAAAAAAAAAALAAPEPSNHPQPANTPAWLVRKPFWLALSMLVFAKPAEPRCGRPSSGGGVMRSIANSSVSVASRLSRVRRSPFASAIRLGTDSQARRLVRVLPGWILLLQGAAGQSRHSTKS